MKYDTFIHEANTLSRLILPKFSKDLLLTFTLEQNGKVFHAFAHRPQGSLQVMTDHPEGVSQDFEIEVQRVTLHQGEIEGRDWETLLLYPEVWTRDLDIDDAWGMVIADLLIAHWRETGHDPHEFSLVFKTIKTGDYRRSLQRTFKYTWKDDPVLQGWINTKSLTPATGTGTIRGDVSKYLLSSWSNPPEVTLDSVSCTNLPFGGWGE